MTDKYNKLVSFGKNSKHIFKADNYNGNEDENVPIIMNWLEYEGLNSIKTLADNEQELFRMSKGIFEVL